MDSCKYWQLATLGTSDYYNVCADTVPLFSFMGIPQNFVGYQESPTHSYAGIITYDYTAPLYKEYIKTTIPPLEIGAIYKVTINVSLADSVKFASDGLGVYFYDEVHLDSANVYCLAVAPQIDYTSYGVIADKINWTTLTANFVADSSYTNLVIGNFKCGAPSNLTTSTYYAAEYWISDESYYYIDSVSVEKIYGAGLNIMNKNSQVRLYPNPAKEELNVAGLTEKTNYNLYSITGVSMQQGELFTSNNIISTKYLAAGIYVLQLTSMDGGRNSIKIIKE